MYIICILYYIYILYVYYNIYFIRYIYIFSIKIEHNLHTNRKDCKKNIYIYIYIHICMCTYLHIYTYIHIGIRLDDTRTAPYSFFINSKAKKTN